MEAPPPPSRQAARAAWLLGLGALCVLGLFFALRSPAARRRRAVEPPPKIAFEMAAAAYKAAPAAERAWPGYEPLSRPLIASFPGRGAVLVGAAKAPPGFLRGETGGRPFFFATWPFPLSSPFVESLEFDGSIVTAIRVKESALATTTFFLHEHFHVFQKDRFSSSPWKRYPVESPVDRALAGVEGAALASWLKTGDPDAMRDFAAARARRRRLFPGSEAELPEERNEGTARFVEMAALEASSGTATVVGRMTRQIALNSSVLTMAKWRHYETGAALCRWLDAEKIGGWRTAVEGGRAPSELALERLALGDAEVERRIARLTSGPAYARAVSAAKDEFVRLLEYRARSLKEYEEIPGRRLVLTSSATFATYSMVDPWIDYPDGSALLVASEWVVERPEIRVRLGRNKCVLRRAGRAEFAVPLDSRVTLDGAPWKFAPGRYRFATLSISSAPLVQVTASAGVLEDDGRRMTLKLDAEP